MQTLEKKVTLKTVTEEQDYETWKKQKIQKWINQADNGEFASKSEVQAFFKKWN